MGWHLRIADTGNCEAPFWTGCQPLFVLAGCLLLDYSSLLRQGHFPTPALQSFLCYMVFLNFLHGYRLHFLITPCLILICHLYVKRKTMNRGLSEQYNEFRYKPTHSLVCMSFPITYANRHLIANLQNHCLT